MRFPRRSRFKNQEGSLMLTTLLVFMVVMLMGVAILRVSSIEGRLANFAIINELARQAADSGVAIARDIIINYRQAGEQIANIGEIELNNGCLVNIEYDSSQIENGIITVTSRGYVKDGQGKTQASKTAVADILVNSVPCYPVRASSLKAASLYYAALSAQVVNSFGEQDWGVVAAEPRLSGDPPLPALYPLQGSTYDCLEPVHLENHPYFTVGNQVWVDWPEPPSSWWIDYRYSSIGSVSFGSGGINDQTLDYHDRQLSRIKLAPFYAPWGYIQVIDQVENPAELVLADGFRNDLDVGESAAIFIDDLSSPIWGGYLSEAWHQSQLVQELLLNDCHFYYPEQALQSQDFIKSALYLNDMDAVKLNNRIFKRFEQLTHTNRQWGYIAEDSGILTRDNNKYLVAMELLDKPFNYFGLSQAETLVFDFGSWLGGGSPGSLASLIEQGQENLVIIAESDLEIIMDSVDFDAINPNLRLYLISAGSIKLTMCDNADLPQARRKLQAFMSANEDIIIDSQVKYWLFQGFINAGDELYLKLAAGRDFIRSEPEPYLIIQSNSELIDQFPQSWDFIGVGTIVGYYYLN